MNPKTTQKAGKRASKHVMHEAEGAASGLALGVILGAAAGPPGMAAGALIGGAIGALAALGLDEGEERRSQTTRELDEEIGVTAGDLGAPNLKHPPSTGGACSAAAAGADTSAGQQPAEGPMQSPE